MIRADDELRHPATDLPEWRESQWYCFDIPERQLGGAIYYAYTPNTEKPSAKLIAYITKGWNRTPNTLTYAFERDFPITDQEWDDLDVGGILKLKRLEPLKRWRLSFADGERFRLDADIDLYAGNWHWIDNPYETPKFLAGDRYHRPFAARGEMMLDGERFAVDLTGDSDHSWGPRRWGPLYKSKYIAFQCGREWAMSAIEIANADGSVTPHGFVWDGRRMSPISKMEVTAEYDEDGIHRAVVMNIVDNESRMTRVTGKSFCSAPTETGDVHNNDCYCTFDVNNGQHQGSGILSFYWNLQYYHRVMSRQAAK